jgi:uncharacterized protein YeaC (DUF1315 family)
MVDYQDIVASLTPDIVRNMKRALETGRWADGRELGDEQREHCMRAVILWDQEHLPETQRTGFIDRGHKRQGEQCDDDSAQTLRWDDSKQRQGEKS